MEIPLLQTMHDAMFFVDILIYRNIHILTFGVNSRFILAIPYLMHYVFQLIAIRILFGGWKALHLILVFLVSEGFVFQFHCFH